MGIRRTTIAIFVTTYLGTHIGVLQYSGRIIDMFVENICFEYNMRLQALRQFPWRSSSHH